MRNWKTTLIGAALAAVTFLATFQANGGNLADWKLWLIPVLAAALGYMAKDAGVTGSAKLIIGCLCLLSLPSCTNPDVERAALGTLGGAAAGYATGGSQGAKLGAATGLANSLAKPAAKQPVNVQP